MSVSITRALAAGTAVAALAGLGVAAAVGAAMPKPTMKTSTVSAKLTPSQETPKPKASKGAGTFAGTLTAAGKLSYTLTFKGLTGPPIAAHLHMGKPGTSGPIVVPLCTSTKTCTSPIKGTKKLTKSFITTMRKGDSYVNVHTAKNPGGEIRGLLKVK